MKIFPAASLGGDLYIRSLKLPLPQIPLIAAGGVSQQTAESFDSGRCFRPRRRNGTASQGRRCKATGSSNPGTGTSLSGISPEGPLPGLVP